MRIANFFYKLGLFKENKSKFQKNHTQIQEILKELRALDSTDPNNHYKFKSLVYNLRELYDKKRQILDDDLKKHLRNPLWLIWAGVKKDYASKYLQYRFDDEIKSIKFKVHFTSNGLIKYSLPDVSNKLWDIKINDIIIKLNLTDNNDIQVCKILMDNMRYQFSYSTFPDGAAMVNNFLVEAVARVYLKLKIKNIIGVQPGVAPVNLVYSLSNKKPEKAEQNNEYDLGDRIAIEIISNDVESKYSKYNAILNTDGFLSIVNNLEIREELHQALISEFAQDIEKEIFTEIKKFAEKTIFKLNPNDKEYKKKLIYTLNRCVNDIAVQTKRSPGNFIILPLAIFNLIKDDLIDYEPSNTTGELCNMLDLGTYNGIQLYSTIYDNIKDDIIIGYKGHQNEYDTGFIWNPYVLLSITGPVIESSTFEHQYGFTRRDGTCLVENFRAYYKTIKIETDEL